MHFVKIEIQIARKSVELIRGIKKKTSNVKREINTHDDRRVFDKIFFVFEPPR